MTKTITKAFTQTDRWVSGSVVVQSLDNGSNYHVTVFPSRNGTSTLTFDISEIPDNATIIEAEFSVGISNVGEYAQCFGAYKRIKSTGGETTKANLLAVLSAMESYDVMEINLLYYGNTMDFFSQYSWGNGTFTRTCYFYTPVLTITYEIPDEGATVSCGVGSAWKPCYVWYGVNNVWKKCKAYFGKDGVWKPVK